MKNSEKMKKRLLGILTSLLIVALLLPLSALATEEALSEDIVILYTNDIHSYIDGKLSYDAVAALKKDLQTRYKHVFLADAGDHVQGTAYGSMDRGQSVICLMNKAEYDVATPGNHEFDYTVKGFWDAVSAASFPYVSCNFYRVENGVRKENALADYALFDCGKESLAFVGITTPETFSKSSPAYFQDENGNYVYGIAGGEGGADLQKDVQRAVDDARSAGATRIVALGHLGVDPSSAPYTSRETISAVSGLDAFIDGHSHSVIREERILDKSGNEVVLTQTGEYFNRIGIMVIDSETGRVSSDFIEYQAESDSLASVLYTKTALLSDAAVKAELLLRMEAVDNALGQKVGKINVTLDNYDSEQNRLVRSEETNSGDFAADALYYLFDQMGLEVDLAVMNGGGIRNQALSGEISYKTCKDIHPFGNVACLLTVTGQQVLDMLEWGARRAGEAEDGSFLQVSGIRYQVDCSVPDTTQAGEQDVWLKGPSRYRVFDVKIYNKKTDAWEEIDLASHYNLAGYNYTLRDLGGGFAMLDGATNVLDYVMEDYMVLAHYVSAFENQTVEGKNSPLLKKYPSFLLDYEDPRGSGRIRVFRDHDIFVGGVKVTEENAADILGDGSASYDPSTKVLTLNALSYTGDGYVYYSHEVENATNDSYSAVLYSNGSLILHLKGESILRNSYENAEKSRHGDGIVVKGGLTLQGDGSLSIQSDHGIEATRDLILDGCTLQIQSQDDAVGVARGSLFLQNGAELRIQSEHDGIYLRQNLVLTDSFLYVEAERNGIDAIHGGISIDSTEVFLSEDGLNLTGSQVVIEAKGDYAVFASKSLTMGEKMTVSAPSGATLGTIQHGESGIFYHTVMVEGSPAKAFSMAPKGFTASVSGQKGEEKFLVPAGRSLNEIYGPRFGIQDFSEILDSERDGYLFGGWYRDEACTEGNEVDFSEPLQADIRIFPKWIPKAPPMGDDRPLFLYSLLCIASFGMLVFSSALYKRNQGIFK
ncbi:MAG: 5'-nucleotidase C-terminal domain-containing protein [Clostridia bacterium]|nr:5'-nucleotidase C-terminal domain-containing protein [Clostridia bacterium]